jgi:hypothetical protein
MLTYKFSTNVINEALKIQSENMEKSSLVSKTNYLIGIIGRLAFLEFLLVNRISFVDFGYEFVINDKSYICKSSGCKFSPKLLDLIVNRDLIYFYNLKYENIISVFVNSYYNSELYLDLYRCNTIFIKGFISVADIRKESMVKENLPYLRYDQSKLFPLEFIDYSNTKEYRRV